MLNFPGIKHMSQFVGKLMIKKFPGCKKKEIAGYVGK